MIRTFLVVAVAALASGCAVSAPPIPNPGGLPADALTLEYILDRGCMPYLLSGVGEDDAMKGVGLQHVHPLPNLDPGGVAPYWRNLLMPGRPLVRPHADHCTVIIWGRDIAAFRSATEAALRQTLGPETETDAATRSRPVLPGQVTGCRQNIGYSYYPAAKSPHFEVDLARGAGCAHDSLRRE